MLKSFEHGRFLFCFIIFVILPLASLKYNQVISIPKMKALRGWYCGRYRADTNGRTGWNQYHGLLSCCCNVVLFCTALWPQLHDQIQYIPRNMHTVFALLCFVVVIHWLIFPYPAGLLRWHCGNLTIAPVPAKQPWWIWINTSCEIIVNDYITTTKQSTTKPCAYLLGYTVYACIPSLIGTWWLHDTETPSASLADGKLPVTGGFPFPKGQ